MLGENLTIQRREEIDIGHAEISAGNLLMNHPCGETAQPQPTKLFWQFGGDEPHRSHLAHQVTVKHARSVTLQKTRRHAGGGKPTRLVGQGPKIIIQIRVHLSPSPTLFHELAEFGLALLFKRLDALFGFLRLVI